MDTSSALRVIQFRIDAINTVAITGGLGAAKMVHLRCWSGSGAGTGVKCGASIESGHGCYTWEGGDTLEQALVNLAAQLVDEPFRPGD